MRRDKKNEEIQQENSLQNIVTKKGVINQQSNATDTIQKNIENILELEKAAIKSRSTAERVADNVTSFAGSTPFIILHHSGLAHGY